MVSGITSNITAYDYTINYTSSLNTSLEEVMVVLGKFPEDNSVLVDPAHTIIISLYCVLVVLAGNHVLLLG